MDKLITAVIIIAVAVFFVWLYYQDDGGGGGAWMATVGAEGQVQSMGPYASYDECSMAVREAVDINVTPYSCSQSAAGD